jgi:hypothetical protein
MESLKRLKILDDLSKKSNGNLDNYSWLISHFLYFIIWEKKYINMFMYMEKRMSF